jgi:hypothetical protein
LDSELSQQLLEVLLLEMVDQYEGLPEILSSADLCQCLGVGGAKAHLSEEL